MVSKEQKKKTTKKSGSQLRIFFNIIGQYHALWLVYWNHFRDFMTLPPTGGRKLVIRSNS